MINIEATIMFAVEIASGGCLYSFGFLIRVFRMHISVMSIFGENNRSSVLHHCRMRNFGQIFVLHLRKDGSEGKNLFLLKAEVTLLLVCSQNAWIA